MTRTASWTWRCWRCEGCWRTKRCPRCWTRTGPGTYCTWSSSPGTPHPPRPGCLWTHRGRFAEAVVVKLLLRCRVWAPTFSWRNAVESLALLFVTVEGRPLGDPARRGRLDEAVVESHLWVVVRHCPEESRNKSRHEACEVKTKHGKEKEQSYSLNFRTFCNITSTSAMYFIWIL